MSERIASLMATIGADVAPFEAGSKKVKGGLNDLKSGFSSVGLSSVASFLSIGGAVAGTVAAIKNASDVTLKYAGEVRDLAAVSGTGAEASSRLLQVLDDYQLTAQDVTAATRFMTKAGLTPTIETLAKLSDEYNAINDPMKQNEFILKNLGRGGLQWVNVLKQGGAALLEQSDAVNKNLILTDKQIQETERYRLAIDNAKDSIEGFKVAAVVGFLDVADKQQKAVDIMKSYGYSTQEINGVLQRHAGKIDDIIRGYDATTTGLQKAANAEDDFTGKLYQATAAVVDAEQAQKDLDASMTKLGAYMQTDLTDAQKSYTEQIAQYNEELKKAHGEEQKSNIKAKIDEATEAYKKETAQMMFATQQALLLQAAQSWSLTPEQMKELPSILNETASAYGLIDENEKHVIDSTNSLIGQWEAGVITTDQLTRMLEANTTSMQKTGRATDELAQKDKNLEGRAEDSKIALMDMNSAQSALGSGIRKDALPAASGLVSQLNRMPVSGTAWSYTFNINVNGKVPSLSNIKYNDSETHTVVGENRYWTGGQLGDGWTVVGDAPGGSWTPYTEVISPSGYVYNARQAQRLKQMGLLGGAQAMFAGSEGPGDPGVHSPGGMAVPKTSSSNKPKNKTNHNVPVGVMAGAQAGIVIGSSATDSGQATGSNATDSAMLNQTTRGTMYQAQTVNILSAILSKLPSAGDNAKAAAIATSKYSG